MTFLEPFPLGNSDHYTFLGNCPSTPPGADLGGGCRGYAPPPPRNDLSFLIQLVFCKKKTMWFIGVEVEQERSAPPPKKNPGPPLPQGPHSHILMTGGSDRG